MRGRLGCQLALVAALGLLAGPARAVVLWQIDTFQDGTLQGWDGGSSPSNQPTGGPSGELGDRYLQLTTMGNPSNLGAFNTAQWSGDYAAAGVTRINIDLKNSGPNPVSMRLMVTTTSGIGCTSPCTAWTSTNATVLPADDQWVKVEFSLAEADLTRVAGTDSYASSVANVARLHLRHDDGLPSPPGTQVLVNAVLGVDNVVSLPEPSRTGGILAGGAVLALLLPRGKAGETRKRNSHRVVRGFPRDSGL